ncbi:MAG: class I adenylate cyclase [Gammaproteobacteria bacterium]|nr:class I adenylate cyclase [Gammaproteobacteria bacterium]
MLSAPSGKSTIRRPASSRSPLERFDAINRERLRRTHDCLLQRQQVFLEVLPLLFHTNHPLLPGYVAQNCPSGIANYGPNRDTLAAVKKNIAKSFVFEHRVQKRWALQGMYLMGSPGTVAYSRESDFDIWLCHADFLEPAELDLLQQKCSGVEKWATELNLEVHFFVIQAEQFKRGEMNRLSAESSGSSQFHLLLDEFYRSALVVAGLRPLWWAVPPDQDHRYEEFIAEQVAKRRLDLTDYIDFGGLSKIPAEEFFGAAVWQLTKSIGSPYKSVQKLLLMEAYAAEYPHSDLVSSRYKAAVYDGENQLNRLDPYVQMYLKVEEYLLPQNDSTRLDVLRRSFYLKAHDKLSRPRISTDPEWRRAILEEAVSGWDWPAYKLTELDNRERWKIESVLQDRRDTIKVLSQCYSRLSEFARQHAGNPRITQRDLNILGRRLYAAFERKPGKLEYVNHRGEANLREEELSLHATEHGDNTSWVLYRGMVGLDAVGDATPIRREANLIDLIGWCHFNGISGPRTWWHLFQGSQSLTATELRAILRFLGERFPAENIYEPTNDDLLKAPRVEDSAFLVNIGYEPMRDRMRDGDVMTSNSGDAFRYAGLRINLTNNFDMIIATSWQELFCFSYEGVGGLLRAMCDYFRWAPLVAGSTPPALTVKSFASQYSSLIERRVEKFFGDVAGFFYAAPVNQRRAYVIEIDDNHYLLTNRGGQMECENLGSYQNLLSALAVAHGTWVETRFDQECLEDSPLPAMFKLNQATHIQVFVETVGSRANIYVVDEYGALTTQVADFTDIRHIYSQLYKFFASTRRHIFIVDDANDSQVENIEIDFFQLSRERSGGYLVERYELQPTAEEYLAVRIFGDVTASGDREYTIYCGNEEFSTRSHGNRMLEAAARFIRSARPSSEHYPIYVTDVDLSPALLTSQGISKLQSAHLLQHKRRLELLLSRALSTPD